MDYKVGCEACRLEIESVEQRRLGEKWCGSMALNVHMEAVDVVGGVVAQSHCFYSCSHIVRLQSHDSRSYVQCPQPRQNLGSVGFHVDLANCGSLRN